VFRSTQYQQASWESSPPKTIFRGKEGFDFEARDEMREKEMGQHRSRPFSRKLVSYLYKTMVTLLQQDSEKGLSEIDNVHLLRRLLNGPKDLRYEVR